VNALEMFSAVLKRNLKLTDVWKSKQMGAIKPEKENPLSERVL
jgi:hypothetical protein